MLFPNERHRYKPDHGTGWDEYWVGIKGHIIDNLLASGYLRPDNPCLYIGLNYSVFNIYNCIVEKTKHEQPGYQLLVSGAVLHLLGTCYAAVKQNAPENKTEELIINKARFLFRSNISNPYSAEQAAEEL
ncbi:MAG: AraC family transcriptional regulator, partial [Candidatus Nephrothrix sp. EaCA]